MTGNGSLLHLNRAVVLVVVFVCLAITPVLAGEMKWTGGAEDGKWESKDNWDPKGPPTENDDVVIPKNSGKITTDGTEKKVKSLNVEDSDTAFSPGDYQSTTATVTLPPGALTAVFAVPVLGDTNVENNETFFVVLTNAVNATLVNGNIGVGAIADGTIPEPPVVVSPPQSVTVTAGVAATFRVRASGTPPLAYQWRFNGSAVPGANADQLDIPFAAIAHEGDYDVVVTNPFGSVTSATAQLSVIATNPAARTGTVLIFEPADDLKPVPESYGDRVTGWLDAQGNRYAPGSGGTPNVTVEYGPTGSFVRLATGPYGALANVACQEDGDFGALEIQLSADPGFQVALRGFDLATLADDVILPRVEVLGSYGVTLHAADDVSVPGLGGTSTRFDFDAAPLVSGSILIRIDLSSLDDTDSHLVGIDNIGFSQVVGSGCPPPPLLAISRSGRNIVLSWPGTGYRLETATTLADVPAASAWTAVAGTSPVTLPMAASGAQFFRLVCP